MARLTADEVKARLAEENPEAILWDGFDDALVGVAVRCAQPALAVYDWDAMIAVLVERDGASVEEAVEHLEHNVVGGWLGPHTPIALQRPEPDA